MTWWRRLFSFQRTPAAANDPDAPLPYEQARELARHHDPEIRRTLAARDDLRPEILYFLAADPDPDVRSAIAGNHMTPPQADLMLAHDSNPEVRGSLAHKISRLAPGLSADERGRLRQLTYETLELLARDQIPRVRQILAEALKDIANAPPEVIRRLAHDSELTVAGPVLEFSPVLTDEDLLEIIRSNPVPGALSAISRRQPVAAPVADAVAASNDAEAIAVLLANHSAQIREETLDMLLDQASSTDIWHSPLVRRPHLSAKAMTRLARFVAESLLLVILERPELDEDMKRAVCDEVRRRVNAQGNAIIAFKRGEAGTETDLPDAAEPPSGAAMERVQRLNLAGALNEDTFLLALTEDDLDFVKAALEVMAGVPSDCVRHVIAVKSAKGIVALAWQAGLSAATAARLQVLLGRILPGDVIRPHADGGYMLSPQDMTWQIEFFQAASDIPGKPERSA